jgi:peptide/nickel transport system ATP-binding protein
MLAREIAPNVVSTVIVLAIILVPQNILYDAALSFLGVGKTDTPSWGGMLATAGELFPQVWWLLLFPGLFLTATVLAFNLLGEGLRDALEPQAAITTTPKDARKSHERPELDAGPPSTASPLLLDVRDLHIDVRMNDHASCVVDGVSFTLERGACLGIVGESGSGKTMTGLALLGLHDPRRIDVSGEIWLEREEVVTSQPSQLRRLRGREIAMVFQDPLSSLSPYHTVGDQIAEAYRAHVAVSRRQARVRAIDVLGRVGIPDPGRRVDDYPHQFSGGMRQRVMIAMALVCDPTVLVADEPTSSLDVTVEAEIVDLLDDLRREFNSAIVFITHDLGIVARIADDVLVMYAGKVVERGAVDAIFRAPQHPYTAGLLRSTIRDERQRRLWAIEGSPPSIGAIPGGCAFHPRCPFARLNGDDCVRVDPRLRETQPGHAVACHLPARERVGLVDRIAAER